MKIGLENRWPGTSSQPQSSSYLNPLANLTIKQIQFNHLNQQTIFKHRNIKNTVTPKIYHGYYKMQNKNKKIFLPGLQLKPMTTTKNFNDDKNSTIKDVKFVKSIGNARNSQILNSIIQILKTDPDAQQPTRIRNIRLKTEPPNINQFIQSRQIFSVKNSRGPKIINNQIMMSANQKYKRNLVSQQKSRPKVLRNQSHSLAKNISKKLDAFDEMEMTFYKPSRAVQKNNVVNLKNLEHNQFILS